MKEFLRNLRNSFLSLPDLLMLVYSYSDTGMIQAIMMEVPGTWASIIDLQYQKTLREFQNAVKYHE